MMIFNVITIFPKIFNSYLKESLLAKAQKKGLLKINFVNLRDFTKDKHKTVDDKPYGGGPGMVLKVEPVYKAVQLLKSKISPAQIFRKKNLGGQENQKSKVRTILFSTRGKKFDSKTARRLALCDQLILICGRYEGVDERVAKYIADEEISIGDYVLSGGELPAMILIEVVSRHIPGMLGKKESLEEIKGSYPVYTRPEILRKWKVPKVLLSGNHKKIEEWRKIHQRTANKARIYE